ncbi:hypothetical protein [uncultured Roseovarius sp.]|uniref:hypothetical protein n=1 Tax=uncultured Roseovarius sp. TaxID=293344 RepID=UPI002624D050|nr:hypothetical protein [uncultured Roseovarius sp.]
MTENHSKDKMVEDLLDLVQRKVPAPPGDLMERILSDAMNVQAGFSQVPDRSERPGILNDLFRVLGGWPAVAGLATATVAGVWLGVFPPGFLSDATGVYLGQDDATFMIDTAAGSGFDLGEEAL